jgi:GNAT superfamily N-acetyltransferase
MEQQIEIRRIEQKDLDAISRIHKDAFPNSAYSKLGLGSIYRYYDWLLNGPHEQLCEAAFIDGKLEGYLFSGKFRGATSGFLKKNRIYLTFRVLSKFYLVLDKEFRQKLDLAGVVLRKLKKDKNYSNHGIESPRYVLLGMAINPKVQGQGLGAKLLASAEREARRLNFTEMVFTVDPGNTDYVNFQLRNGSKKLPDTDEWKGVMIKRTDDTSVYKK